MMGRFRIAVVVTVVVVATALGASSAVARKQSFCGYVRRHTFEFTQVFSPDTNPVIAAASSELEIKRLEKWAPRVLKADFKTFRKLLVAIRTQNSDAIRAIAPDAGAASKRILDYVKNKCGVTATPPST
jgi:hypothetical protein